MTCNIEKINIADSGSATYDPCIDNEVESYFNRPEVQQAMHANLTALPWRWTGCSPLVEYSQWVPPLDPMRMASVEGLCRWYWELGFLGLISKP